jgi:uncharacterized protein YgiM (DUF1202 family)
MKMNCWLVFGMMLSTSLLAQQVTNAPPAAPIENAAPAASATSTNAPENPPAKAPKKKSGAKKKKAKQPAANKDAAAQLKTVPLVPGLATVEANHVNVRGQPKLNSEVVTRLSKGDTVTVIEEIIRNNSGPDEPSAWAKVYLPTNAHVWLNTAYIDPTNKTVLPKRLNLRSGPGENYSVLGRLVHGDTVTEKGTKGDWTEIEAPTNAYAFMAAQYLRQEAAAATEPPPATTAVSEAPAIAAAPTEPPPTTPLAETAPATNAVTENVAGTNAVPETAPVEEPPPKRIVDREGMVRGTFSVQAPTHFELVSPDNGRTIDYLYTTSPNLDLRRYKGLRIIVTGEESLEERWGNTPVITIQKIQVLE